jgi:hypothetical protein
MKPKPIDAFINLAGLFTDTFEAVLILAGDGVPGSDMIITVKGDHDANTRCWVAFLEQNPDYISVIFRAMNTVFTSPEIDMIHKLPLMEAFKEEMQGVTELMEMIINNCKP